MEKYKPVILLGAGIIVALITSIITYNWLQKKGEVKDESSVLKTQKIAVAAVDIPWGKALKKEMIKFAPFLKESLPEGYFFNASSLEGRVLLTSLMENEPIIESKLAPTGATGGVSAIISPKKRAMAVKVDKVIGVSGFIHPGNHVDVLVTLKQRGRTASVTKIVLENVLVLAAGTKIEKDVKTRKSTQVDVITLEVTPTEAEKLALAATEGKIQLAIRGFKDTDDVLTRGTTRNTLLASYSPKKKIYRKKTSYTVEVIKGTNISKLKLKRR